MTNQKTAALITVAISNLLIMLALVPVSAVLPTIGLHFNADVSSSSWVVTSFLLSLTSCLLVAGRLGDMYGHRRVFLVGVVLYTVIGTGAGLAQSIGALVVLRAIQGIGAAMMAGNSLAIIANVFTAEERGKAIGIAGMASSVGAVLGVTVSTLLAQFLTWQWLFFLTLPLGVIGIKSVLDMKVDFRPTVRPKIDYLGAVLLAVAVVALSLALHQHGDDAGGFSDLFYRRAMPAVTAVALALFVVVEKRAPQPMVELGYLKNASFSFSIIANEIFHMTMMSASFLTPFLVEMGLGLPPVYTAGVMISTQLGNIIMAPLSGMIYDRTRWRFLSPGAMVFISAGLGSLALFAPRMPYPVLLGVAFVLGIGLGFFMTPNNTIVMGSVPAHLRGFAAGMLETSRQFGHTFGVGASSAVMATALAGVVSGSSAAPAYLAGYQNAGLMIAALAFLGILAALVHSFSKEARAASLSRAAVESPSALTSNP